MLLNALMGEDNPGANTMLQEARKYRLAYIGHDNSGSQVGVSVAALIIRDNLPMNKRIIVPSRQTYAIPGITHHNIACVLIQGTRNRYAGLESCENALLMGWIPAGHLKRWCRHIDHAPFKSDKATLAVAPVTVLRPITQLGTMLRWHTACV